MLETPHVIVGATIATKVVHPALAIPLSFLSHFALERVPHWNPHLNSEKKKFGKVTMRSTQIVAADTILALTLGSYIAWRALPNTTLALTILASSFFASLPDIIEGPYFFLGIESKTRTLCRVGQSIETQKTRWSQNQCRSSDRWRYRVCRSGSMG